MQDIAIHLLSSFIRQAQENSLVAVKHAGDIVDSDGRRTFFYWMKAKTSQKHAAPFQKVLFLSLVLCGSLC
jgi:hypothetical protein